MTVPVTLQRVTNNGYRATALAPALTAEAPTREEALEKLRDMIGSRMADGELVQLRLPDPESPDPWLAIAGSWQAHCDAAELEEQISDYRREVDADPARP